MIIFGAGGFAKEILEVLSQNSLDSNVVFLIMYLMLKIT